MAHALLRAWVVSPNAQQALQSELKGWQQRQVGSAEGYLALMAERLASAGIERQALRALKGVENDFRSVDIRLQKMFRTAADLAGKSYQKWTGGKPASPRLEVAVAINPVYPDQADFGELGAVACVPPREGTDPATVKLTFAPTLLGPPSWAVVPYLLCHEIVCHVYQSAPMAGEDAFAEGWMDLVALRLHHQWAPRIFPWEPALARWYAERLSRDVLQRRENLPEPEQTTRGIRSQGRLAAEWVEETLQRLLPGSTPPAAEMIWLSLQLNRTPATLADRLEFVTQVVEARGSRGIARAKLLAQLRLWADGGYDPGGAAKVLSFA